MKRHGNGKEIKYTVILIYKTAILAKIGPFPRLDCVFRDFLQVFQSWLAKGPVKIDKNIHFLNEYT